MTAIENRLHAYHRELEAGLALPLPRQNAGGRASMRRYIPAAVLGLLIAIAIPPTATRLLYHSSSPTATLTITVSGFTVVQAADNQGTSPRITGDQAAAVALDWVAHQPNDAPGVAGFRVVDKSFHAHVYSVEWIDGGYGSSQPSNLWLISLQAPVQADGWHADAHVLVDADSGKLSSGSTYVYKCPAPPASPASDYPGCP